MTLLDDLAEARREIERLREANAKKDADAESAYRYAARLLDGFAPPTCTDRVPGLLGILSQIDNLMCGMRSDNERLREALRVEREACDAWRVDHVEYGYGDRCGVNLRCEKCIAHDARRAAERKDEHA